MKNDVICPLCYEGSYIDNWNKITEQHFNKHIKQLRENDFYKNGINKDSFSKCRIYVCPKCKQLVPSYNLFAKGDDKK